jgi:hypothetical protein
MGGECSRFGTGEKYIRGFSYKDGKILPLILSSSWFDSRRYQIF